ncbi:C45 family autoproteolytic acyltransferase/hydolase [Pseudotamlana carrageenivorans]|uniref:Acyl-CoA--6-aminopenicillanic acid acyl-transferase n=1 Tax=Pseudotamlana carrageenivorans TaxID=2069432 RepID=A0A2I7SHE0_9FLAO|nr:C45 family peptidase [Tamlana carrageenivorans]AUS05317.1 acyl-CoA--6-aminopenicillanic acid acyl-transferase [Tamlana carrageenivorans]
MNKKIGLLHNVLSLACIMLVLPSCGVSSSLQDVPYVSDYNDSIPKRIQKNDSSFVLGNNRLNKNKQGLWELYVEGDPYERGLITGSLTRELFQNQERYFLSKIEDLVPSETNQKFLQRFVAWYNRKMYLHIDNEYKSEIYGLSKYALNAGTVFTSPYLRCLYFHGAHDIGHALQDLALVGCSSFAVWNDKTKDGSLIIGRNFDFYAGDDFAKDKIIAFTNPKTGYKFMSISWGGMIGVVSGMNEHGLTVTINAGKSKVPLIAKTPISIVNREILQYATNIEEAIAIAKKREVFVSESIFVGSAADNKAIIIEVSPDNFGVFEATNSNQIICSNHFQSDAYAEDKINQKHMVESHSLYRYQRMEQLLNAEDKLTPQKAVAILRNKEGLNGKSIGYGNEKALNQLLAHHAVVFKPKERLVWVSSNPYQLGEFVAYNLNDVFKHPEKQGYASARLNIEKDPFQYTEAYKNYERYRVLKAQVLKALNTNETLNFSVLHNLQSANPNFWEAHYLTGLYYFKNDFDMAALKAFKKAKTKEVTTVTDLENINSYIKKLNRKLGL